MKPDIPGAEQVVERAQPAQRARRASRRHVRLRRSWGAGATPVPPSNLTQFTTGVVKDIIVNIFR